MYVVIRTWANGGAVADAIVSRQQEVADLISSVPGFVAYYATRSGDTLTTITVTEDQDGSRESTRRAGEWVKQNLAGVSIEAPQIAEGETIVHA